MASITASVGRGGRNHLADVRVLQEAFNSLPAQHGRPSPLLAVDGACGRHTVAAIARFQLQHFGWTDRRVDCGGLSIRAINEMLGLRGPGFHHSPEAAAARAQHRARLRGLLALQQGPVVGAPTSVVGPRTSTAREQLHHTEVGRQILESEQGCLGRVRHATGEVYLLRHGHRHRVAGGQSLLAHDTVFTGPSGQAELVLEDGASVSMRPETMIMLGGAVGPSRTAGMPAQPESGALPARLAPLRGLAPLPAL